MSFYGIERFRPWRWPHEPLPRVKPLPPESQCTTPIPEPFVDMFCMYQPTRPIPDWVRGKASHNHTIDCDGTYFLHADGRVTHSCDGLKPSDECLALAEAIDGALSTPNEVRRQVGLEPLDGGYTFFRPRYWNPMGGGYSAVEARKPFWPGPPNAFEVVILFGLLRWRHEP